MIDKPSVGPNNDLFIYIFTRLFDFSEKIKAGQVEQAALNAVYNFIGGELAFEASPVFVPFRDTAQDQIVSDNKAKVIYEEDLKRLDRSTVILGILDGQSKDEGVCFEIGYAYGIRVPSVVLLTDFIRREFKEIGGSTHLVDPVLLCMITRIVYHYQIQNGENKFEDRLKQSLDAALGELSLNLKDVLDSNTKPSEVIPTRDIDVYIDVGGGRFEWERLLMEQVHNQLTELGLRVEFSQRNFPMSPSETEGKNISEVIQTRGMRDIMASSRAKVVITCADMEEMSSGTAAIHGLARAQGKNLILIDSSTIDLVGDGEHRMSRNLMIDQSADLVVREYDGIPMIIKQLIEQCIFT